ncbi:MAG: NAD+ synthase, partial [Phycisphaerales bacterium]|nr:NAD+ synthase [Phycisphaerales bacterium]
MRIAMGQINPTVGDIDGNAEKVAACIERGIAAGVDLVIVPELAITGYPPKDLLLKRSFVKQCGEALRRIAERADGVTVIVGCVSPSDREHGHGLFNSAAVCAGGEVVATYHKRLLPTYDVFDEHRYFDAGRVPGLV